jgi:uncharacterized protein (TIGR02246 family)
MRRLVPVPVVLLVLAACAPSGQQDVATTQADIEAVRSLFAESNAALNAGDAEGTLAAWADDAISMPPDTVPVVGKNAIRPGLQRFLDQYTTSLTTEIDDIMVSGDLAVVIATWDQTSTPKAEGEATQGHGKWVVVFEKQADGSWRGRYEIWSQFTPPQAM